MPKSLDDQFGRPPVKDVTRSEGGTTIEAMYWLLGYISASKQEKSEDCPFKTGLKSYEYWQRGYKAKMENKIKK